MSQLPHGWALHPQDPRYMYEVANPTNAGAGCLLGQWCG
jgi:hypothetical protein